MARWGEDPQPLCEWSRPSTAHHCIVMDQTLTHGWFGFVLAPKYPWFQDKQLVPKLSLLGTPFVDKKVFPPPHTKITSLLSTTVFYFENWFIMKIDQILSACAQNRPGAETIAARHDPAVEVHMCCWCERHTVNKGAEGKLARRFAHIRGTAGVSLALPRLPSNRSAPLLWGTPPTLGTTDTEQWAN